MDSRSTLRATVRQLTAESATLEVAGQALTWPIAAVPDDIKEGDTIILKLQTEAEAETESHEHARHLLTEILGGNP